MDIFLQQLANGLINGACYMLIATGVTLVFGILRIVNFAHGEFYMLGAFGVFLISAKLGLAYAPAVLASILLVFLAGVLIEVVLFRPLRGQHEFTILLSSLGLSLLIVSLTEHFVGAEPIYVQSPYADIPVEIGPVFVTEQKLLVAGVAVVALLALMWFLKRTIYGRMMQATAENLTGAAVTGLHVNTIYTLTFGLAAALAALAGALVGPTTIIYPTIGGWATLKGFVVVVLGGLGSVPGAILGGLVLGISEAFAGDYLGSGFRDVIGYGIIVLALILRPQGLFKPAGSR